MRGDLGTTTQQNKFYEYFCRFNSPHIISVRSSKHASPPILLLLIHLCALNYCLAMLCYVLMKHDAPSTVLQTGVLRQYLFSRSKIVLSIFLRNFFLPWLFFANWSGAAILFFLFLFSFSLIVFHFFPFKVDVWKKISQLLKNLQLFCWYLGLFFFKHIFRIACLALGVVIFAGHPLLVRAATVRTLFSL